MDGYFLAVYKELFGLGLKSVDLLIISQVYEYQRKDMNCYVTNEQLSNWFGESVSTIERSIKKLTNLNIIDKKTTFIKGMKGKVDKNTGDKQKAGNRQREMKLNPRELWDVEIIDDSWNRHNEGSNSSWNPHIEGSNLSWNRHNDVTIDKTVKKTVSIKEEQNTENADAELVIDDSSCSTEKSKSSKSYKSPEELPTNVLQEILEGLEEYQTSGGARGLSYKDIARKYEIKQEYLDKRLPKWIKNILHNRECANKMIEDSYPNYDDDYFDNDSDSENLSDYLNGRQAKEILDTFDSLSDDSKARNHYQDTFYRDYDIPETVMSNYFGYVDLVSELRRIAA